MAIQLVLTELFSTTLEAKGLTLEAWRPSSNNDVFIPLSMDIGAKDQVGVNCFYVTLATPEGLRQFNDGFCLVKNRTIVIDRYDYVKVKGLIQQILDQCARQTWEESCQVLQWYFDWEYEDYVQP